MEIFIKLLEWVLHCHVQFAVIFFFLNHAESVVSEAIPDTKSWWSALSSQTQGHLLACYFSRHIWRQVPDLLGSNTATSVSFEYLLLLGEKKSLQWNMCCIKNFEVPAQESRLRFSAFHWTIAFSNPYHQERIAREVYPNSVQCF